MGSSDVFCPGDPKNINFSAVSWDLEDSVQNFFILNLILRFVLFCLSISKAPRMKEVYTVRVLTYLGLKSFKIGPIIRKLQLFKSFDIRDIFEKLRWIGEYIKQTA